MSIRIVSDSMCDVPKTSKVSLMEFISILDEEISLGNEVIVINGFIMKNKWKTHEIVKL